MKDNNHKNNVTVFEIDSEIAYELLNAGNIQKLSNEAYDYASTIEYGFGVGTFMIYGGMHDQKYTVCDATNKLCLCTKLAYVRSFSLTERFSG